ncbi:hypothetical protein QWJ34_00045 [Saccharibacillus sp. CPCC 101409]|uniref:hypothetical protein n=1 Tax=Saccharibacillus sp. CPCC 101409 TaxID=3058041 RepID=UPI002673D92A|nr:hypothetical protein [Saccharibacillus sp. CPCC 101409]MDO3408146.1 hypothetical protein [Saccharibacillus sp. CPCC 101409]
MDFLALREAAEHPVEAIEKRRETIEAYLIFRQTAEYRSSPAYLLQREMTEFQQTSGYTDIFLPQLKALSPAYRDYCERLERANAEFLALYPKASDPFTS